MKALLLIGGMATRLSPLSKTLPKSLLPVCDREILHYQVMQLAYAGINEIVLAAGHLVDELREYTSHYSGGLTFHYSIEAEPMGTAGAIAQAREYLDGDDVVVLNADILSSVKIADVIKAHKDGGRPATITGFAVDDPSRYGLLRVEDDKLTGFSEKPEGGLTEGKHFINAGVYVLSPEAYNEIPAGQKVSIERQTFPMLISQHQALTHYPHEGIWMDIGTFESYHQANFILLAHRYAAGEDWLWGDRDDCAVFKDLIYLSKSARLGKDVDLFHRVAVMRDTVIGDGSRLRNSLVMPGAIVGADCQLNDCIVGPGVEVDSRQKLSNLVLINDEPNTAFYPHSTEM